MLRRSPGFVQLVADGVLVDIAHNYLADPPVDGTIGLRCADADLVGGKLEALFTRRVNRDVVDVAQLLDRYTMRDLVRFATNRDAGFDVAVTIEMTSGNDYDRRQGFSKHDFEAAKRRSCCIFSKPTPAENPTEPPSALRADAALGFFLTSRCMLVT